MSEAVTTRVARTVTSTASSQETGRCHARVHQADVDRGRCPFLKKLLENDEAVRAYHTFLKKEYNEDTLEFLMEATKLEKFDSADQANLAVQVYDQYISKGGHSGVGQQLRTEATEKLWSKGLSPTMVCLSTPDLPCAAFARKPILC